MCQISLHELAALHLKVEGIHEHLLRELDLHARNNMTPQMKERWDRVISMPLELGQVSDPIGEVHFRVHANASFPHPFLPRPKPNYTPGR
eukprot:6844022-Heterocapsa_arctica.AAC.1